MAGRQRVGEDRGLWARSASSMAEGVARRRFTSTELVDAHLERVAEVNPSLNAVVAVLAEQARDAARAADEAVAAGRPLGALHGVPVTVKENVDVAGLPTTEGVRALAGVTATSDAPTVERLRGAGAVVLGRTNLPDFGLRIHTDSQLHGATRNPWDASVTPGGSSGGEAAAIASGMSPLGVGNDIGGSLRNPAHCCGIASIKPTTGRVPDARSLDPLDSGIAAQLMAVQGVMARTVEDVRRGLSVVAGAHVRDPGSLPVPLDLPRPAAPVRVALLPEPPGGPTDAGVAGVVRHAGDVLADAGYDVVEAEPPAYEQTADVWGRLLLTDVRALRPLLQQVMGPDALRFLDLTDELYADLDVAGLVGLFVERRALARLWSQFLAEHPLLVCPVWTTPAFEVGFDVRGAQEAAETLRLLRPVMPANLLGLPAAVVPGGLAGGMPVGVQVVGDRFAEMLCLDAAEAVEAAVGVLTPVDPV